MCELDYNGADGRKCCALAAALLRGNALQWHKRLHRNSQAPTDYAALRVVMTKQFGIVDDARRARDVLYTLK